MSNGRLSSFLQVFSRSMDDGTLLGIIALAFENDFDIAFILTKGTKTLAKQTLHGVRDEFGPLLARDGVQIYDARDHRCSGAPEQCHEGAGHDTTGGRHRKAPRQGVPMLMLFSQDTLSPPGRWYVNCTGG